MDAARSSRPPPSYSQAVVLHPPVPRTISGSDTDVSTSTENLTHEEKYVLSHTERQEPQGEENLVTPSPVAVDFGAPPAAMEWAKSVDVFKCPALPVLASSRAPPQYQYPVVSGGGGGVGVLRGAPVPSPAVAAAAAGLRHQQKVAGCVSVASVQQHSRYNAGDTTTKIAGVTACAVAAAAVASSSSCPAASSSSLSTCSAVVPVLVNSQTLSTAGGELVMSTSSSSSTAPSRCSSALSQSVVSRGIGRTVAATPASCQPPQQQQLLQHQQQQSQQQQQQASCAVRKSEQGSTRSHVLNSLLQENASLKQDVEAYRIKVHKLQKFAQELSKLQTAYDDLVRTCQRREQLESLARHKLSAEVRRATELNSTLSNQLDSSSVAAPTAAAAAVVVGDERRELLLQQLLAQNKELQVWRERQEVELNAQRVTLQEQRQYIDILDTALAKAQENTVNVERQHAERIQSEFIERSTYVERVSQLQRALTSCQLAAERREAAHRKIRQDLERELAEVRLARQHSNSGGVVCDENVREAQMAELRHQFRAANERILLLETELAHAQQRFVETGAESEAALLLNASIVNLTASGGGATVPSVAGRVAPYSGITAALTPSTPAATPTINSSSLALNRTHTAQSIEQRMLTLEAQLVEKEAMVRALQRRQALDSAAAEHVRQSSVQSLPASSPTSGVVVSQCPVYLTPRVARDMLGASVTTPLVSSTVTAADAGGAADGGLSQASACRSVDSLADSFSTVCLSAAGGGGVAAGSDIRNTVQQAPAAAAAVTVPARDTSSILLALQQDREVFPDHYWQV